MIKRKEDHNHEVIIDLTGPDGNAFSLMGFASQWYKQMGRPKEDYEKLQTEMMSGDYENLVSIMDREFGSIVTFLR